MPRRCLYLYLCLAFCVHAVAAQGGLAYEDADAYAIYSLVISERFPKAKSLVIQIENTDYPAYQFLKETCLKPARGQEATLGPVIKAYQQANEKSWVLTRKFEVSVPYELVEKVTIDGLVGPRGWPRFHERYPDSSAALHMSAVGFNADRTLALVYFGHRCEGLCGEGRYYFLEKKNSKWSEKTWDGKLCAWIS